MIPFLHRRPGWASANLEGVHIVSEKPIQAGSDRQLFLDEIWFDTQNNVRLKMHPPVVREIALSADQPWESGGVHYSSVLKDGDRYRMWYRADGIDPNKDMESYSCYAESSDGVHWEKPNLGIVEYQGSTQNNIFYPTEGFPAINPSVILDKGAPPSERYKMIVQGKGNILGYTSPDGIRWEQLPNNPIQTERPFDSHNVLLWDDERQRYVIYMRGVSESVPGTLIWNDERQGYDHSPPGTFNGGHRAIRRSESKDFVNWTRPEMVFDGDADDPPGIHFYTNSAAKYHRAAQAYLMFPMILYPGRINPEAPFPGLSDVQMATSRDGIAWGRQFREPFLRPGLDPRNWVDRNPIMGPGILETGPDELSMYYSELLRETEDQPRFRRCSLRTDGFVSVEGPYKGWGEFVTPPLTFAGDRLEMNYSTAGGGSIFVELQEEDGTPIKGLSLDDCNEMFGDKIEGIVSWSGDAGLKAHTGKPVRLRIKLRDASLYAFRFVG